MSTVTLAGLWEPGTVVSLHQVDGPHVLRAHGSPVEQRIADRNGTVGFIVDEGDRFMALGFDVHGERIELRCRALEDHEGSELAQAPILPTPQTRGATEVPAPVIVPGAPEAELGVGIAAPSVPAEPSEAPAPSTAAATGDTPATEPVAGEFSPAAPSAVTAAPAPAEADTPQP
jgi:hypothetical protein